MGRDFGKKTSSSAILLDKRRRKGINRAEIEKIDISDTALGRAKAVRHNQLHLAYNNMSENKKRFFLDIKESQ